MASSKTGHPQHVHIVLYGLFSSFLRRLEQRADIYVKTDIGKAGSNDLGAAVVAIVFLSVFVVLIVGDGILSGIAIWKAVHRGQQMPDRERVRRAKEVLLRLCVVDMCPGLEAMPLKADVVKPW